MDITGIGMRRAKKLNLKEKNYKGYRIMIVT
jgi:hypothetical protein